MIKITLKIVMFYFLIYSSDILFAQSVEDKSLIILKNSNEFRINDSKLTLDLEIWNISNDTIIIYKDFVVQGLSMENNFNVWPNPKNFEPNSLIFYSNKIHKFEGFGSIPYEFSEFPQLILILPHKNILYNINIYFDATYNDNINWELNGFITYMKKLDFVDLIRLNDKLNFEKLFEQFTFLDEIKLDLYLGEDQILTKEKDDKLYYLKNGFNLFVQF